MRTIYGDSGPRRPKPHSPQATIHHSARPKWYSKEYLSSVWAKRPAKILALLAFVSIAAILIAVFAATGTTVWGGTSANLFNGPGVTHDPGIAVSADGKSATLATGSTGGGGINPTTWAPNSGAYVFERPNFGTAATDYQDFTSRESSIGGKYDGFMDYVTCNTGSSELQDAHDALANGSPFVVLSWCTGSNPTSIIPSIAAGSYDTDIRNFATAVKAQLSGVANAHIIVRPFWEFNYQGSEWDAKNYGGDYTKFGLAFTRFETVFAGAGVTNVKWSLNAIRIGSSTSDSPAPYYDAIISAGGHVDWMGIDAYPKNQWLSLPTMLTTSASGTFNWYSWAAGKGIPLMTGETGILPCDHYPSCAQTRADWWANIASSLPSYPALKAVEIFDAQENPPTSPNWKIDAPGPTNDSATQSLTAYQQWVKSSFSNPLNLR